jgi:hypothetical protein
MKRQSVSGLTPLVIILILGALCAIPLVSEGQNGGVTLTTTLRTGGTLIKNQFSALNYWDFRWDWLDKAEGSAPDYFKKNYPFIKEIIFMMATGGNGNRDLLANYKDPNSAYKFDPLIKACRNVVKQGLKPRIKTGNVPERFSKTPLFRVYDMNVKPPADYNKYYNYIKALSDALVKEFGAEEVRTWSWGVLNEFDNADIFRGVEETQAGHRAEFFKLYDYTVAALEDSIGEKNLIVGAHAMFTPSSTFNALDLLDHCTKGTNSKTGKQGTQIDYFAISYYDYDPRSAGDFSALSTSLKRIRAKADEVKLPELKVGIEEGILIIGPDGQQLMMTRNIGTSYQGSYDAFLFKTLTDNGGDYYSRWAINSSLWNGADSVGANVTKLAYKMAGESRLDVSRSGSVINKGNHVEAIATYNQQTSTVHIFAFNHNPSFNQNSTEPLTLKINDIRAKDGTALSVKQWIVDDQHSNFFQTWLKDKSANGIQLIFSQYDMVPFFASDGQRTYFNSRLETYKKLGALMESITSTVTPIDNTVTLSHTLAHHSVTLFEITNATIASNVAPKPTPTATPTASPTAIPTPQPTPDKSPKTHSITLKKGWNLLSLPIQPVDSFIESVLKPVDSSIGAVFGYNAREKRYEAYIPKEIFTLKRLFAGQGYWIYMEKEALLSVTGHESNEPVDLVEGWNLVGFNSVTRMRIGAAVRSIKDSISAVYGFEPAENRYLGYTPKGEQIELQFMAPGSGYWIYSNKDQKWTLN